MLEKMGVEIPLRLLVAGGGSGTSTITITKPSAEVVDDIIISGERSLDPAPIFLIPPTFRTSVPQMKGWSDDEIRAYLLSNDGYASYLRGGGVPVQSLDNMVTGAYHDSQNGVPYDGNNIPPPKQPPPKVTTDNTQEPIETPPEQQGPDNRQEEKKQHEEEPTTDDISRMVTRLVRWTKLYLRNIPRIRAVIRFLLRKSDAAVGNADWDDGDIILEPVDWDWDNDRPARSGDVDKRVTSDELPTEGDETKT